MSIKTYFLNLSLNRKLIGMMLVLSFILLSALTFLYSQSEKALFEEIEMQTAELSKAIQVGVEEVTSQGIYRRDKTSDIPEDAQCQRFRKRYRSSAIRMKSLRARTR